MNTIYGIQFSGPSAPNTLHPRLLKKCCLFPNPRVFRAPDLWYTFAFFEHENHEFICEGQRVGDVTQLRFCLNVISITYLFNVWSLLNWKQWTSWTCHTWGLSGNCLFPIIGSEPVELPWWVHRWKPPLKYQKYHLFSCSLMMPDYKTTCVWPYSDEKSHDNTIMIFTIL